VCIVLIDAKNKKIEINVENVARVTAVRVFIFLKKLQVTAKTKVVCSYRRQPHIMSALCRLTYFFLVFLPQTRPKYYAG